MTDIKLIWYAVPDVSGVFVNRLGQIGVDKGSGIIYTSGQTHPAGYLTLYFNGKTWFQHILVATTFLGMKPGPKYEVNHKDDDRAHNKPGNLEWVTKRGNNDHAYRQDKLETTKAWSRHKVPPRRLSDEEVKELLRDSKFMTVQDLKDKYKVPAYFIKQLFSAHGMQRSHKDSPHFIPFDYEGVSKHIDTRDLKAYSSGTGTIKVRQPD